ncbi:MAG: hypothetical protein ACLT33_13585 [Lachnospira pectinoschiza]
MDERTVITIGREFGSGGHEIGKKPQRSWKSATTRTVELAAKESGLVKNFSDSG